MYAANNPINAIDPSGQFAMGDMAITSKSVALRNLEIMTEIGIGIIAIYIAVNVLLAEVDVPRVLPKFKSLETIKMEEQWRERQDLLNKLQQKPDPSEDPEEGPSPWPPGTDLPPSKPRDSSFDIAFGVTAHLPVFTVAVGWDTKRLVLFWDEWGKYGLKDPAPDESLPAKKGRTASIYVGTAAIWSSRFPEAQYPEAKIRFNLKEIEGGPEPGVTLWEYYLFKKQQMLWKRIVFYDFSSSGYDIENSATYPKPLEGGALESRREQIESSKNYLTIENLMGPSVP